MTTVTHYDPNGCGAYCGRSHVARRSGSVTKVTCVACNRLLARDAVIVGIEVVSGNPGAYNFSTATDADLVRIAVETIGDDAKPGNEASETHLSKENPGLWAAMQLLLS